MTPNRNKPSPEENEPQQGFLKCIVRKSGALMHSVRDSFQELMTGTAHEPTVADEPKPPPKIPAVTNVSHTVTPRLVTCLDMKAWPFLFSRTFSVDYGTVALPEFINKAGAGREIGNACDNFTDIGSDAIHMKCFHSNVGEFDLIVRVVTGAERMLGKESDAVLHDNVGRPIRIVEGVAFQGRLAPEQLHFTANQMEAAHQALEPHFREFWKGDFIRPPVANTQAIDLPVAVGGAITLHPKETPAVKALANEVPTVQRMVEPPKLELPKSGKLPPRGGLNTTVFLVVTGVAVGAFLTYRHFTKTKNTQQTFAQRMSQPASSSPPSRSV